MEDWESEIDKQSKAPIVVIVLLVLVVLGLVGYICYDKEIIFQKKQPVKVENQIKKEPLEELYIESDFVQKYYQIYREDTCLKETYYAQLENSYPAKLYMTYLQLANDAMKSLDCAVIENETIENAEFCGKYEDAKQTSFLEEDTFYRKYRELFGQKAAYELNDFEIGTGLYHYDAKNSGYVFYGKETETSCMAGEVSLERATLKGDTLTIYTKVDNHSLEDDTKANKEITYILEKEKETGNYIFKSRREKEINALENEE